jgi:tetratricopeptide (TPR) repeat protein
MYALALYGTGKYREAIRELQAYKRMTGRADQNHVLADSYRALGEPERAIPLADEATRASLPDSVRAEAAVVGGAALADLGRYEEALTLLRRFAKKSTSTHPHDLRIWYVMGDVLERAGRKSEAVDRFKRIMEVDPDAYDVAERLSALS